MPFSFIDIEENKSRVITLVFIFIIFFYFLTAYLLLIVIENSYAIPAVERAGSGFSLPPLNHVLAALIIAFVAGFLHWSFSTGNLIERLSLAVGAMPIDTKDTYHQYLKNIVEEVSLAMGARHIEAMVIPSAGMNAFSLEDFNRRAVIGVTEGLLSRLSRSQIEAVVAHEAGHIAAGDSLTATVVASLSEIYEESLAKLNATLRKVRGRGVIALVSVFLIISIVNFLSKLLRYFISRQREFRADAIAVRLTRDPLSLAEALKLISTRWRGEGSQGDKLESLFIVNPRVNDLDEREGFTADIFSTHPPVRKRIGILLGMAHMDAKTLEENLKGFKRVSPVAAGEFKSLDEPQVKRWFIFQNRQWQGPFLWEELEKAGMLRPDQWVRLQGKEEVVPAYEDPGLRQLFKKDEDRKAEPVCPHCESDLQQINYEGAPVLKCVHCQGLFVEQDKISRIFIRNDISFSDETVRLAKTLIASRDKFRLKKADAKSAWVIKCPKCRRTMHRQFFIYSYPVEIDRCAYCCGVWFDRLELELLQYLYEHKEIYFQVEHF